MLVAPLTSHLILEDHTRTGSVLMPLLDKFSELARVMEFLYNFMVAF